MIVSSEIKGYFAEPDRDGNVSHSEIIRRLGWKENNDIHLRRFVRVECADWTINSFRFDEDSTLPSWADEYANEIMVMVNKTLDRVAPALAEYEQVLDAALAEYKRVLYAARAEYERVFDAARAEYEQVLYAARAENDRVLDAAWAEMVRQMARADGYIAPVEEEQS